MRLRKMVFDRLLVIVLAAGSVTMIGPFLWMLSTSLDWSARLAIPFPPRLFPADFSWKPYVAAFTNVPMLKYIWNSVLVSFGVIAISVMSALLSGYALSKIPFRSGNAVLLIALSTMMIPVEVTMIPQYLLFSRLHLIDSYWAFYLPAMNFAFGTFLAKAFMDALPSSLRESSFIDGASEFLSFRKIYLPLCSPIIATLVILQFLAVWNDLLWPLLILNTPDKFTVQLGLATFTFNRITGQLPAIIMAATMISMVPVLTLYLLLQRYIVESIALTGIKQ